MRAASSERSGPAARRSRRRSHSGPPRPHAAPGAPGAFDIQLRLFEKHFEGRTARKAVEPAVVGIGPIQRAVGLDFCAGRDAERIEVVEFAIHRFRRHRRLPNAGRVARRQRDAGRCVRRGGWRGRDRGASRGGGNGQPCGLSRGSTMGSVMNHFLQCPRSRGVLSRRSILPSSPQPAKVPRSPWRRFDLAATASNIARCGNPRRPQPHRR